MKLVHSEDCCTYICGRKADGMPMQEAHRLRAELADVKQESDQQKQRLHKQLHSLQHGLDHARAQNISLENRSDCLRCRFCF